MNREMKIMKRMFAVLAAVALVFYFSAAAHAGGGAGPSKDMLKGVFTEVNAADRTAVFVKDGKR
jgi:type IV secretory pathway VirB2 component (pilin)